MIHTQAYFLFVLGCPAVILFGIAVLVARRLVCGPPDPARVDSMELALTVIGWVQITVGLVGILAGLLQVASILTLIVAVFVVIEAFVHRRQSNQYSLLWVMTVAAERLIPMAPAVEALAQERSGLFAARVRWLAHLLRGGASLPDALRHTSGLVPRDALLVIRVGCESGALAAALRQAGSLREVQRPLWLVMTGRLLYLLTVVTFGGLVLTFLFAQIVPNMQAIFDDFGAEVPRLTQMVIWVSDVAFDLSPLFLLFFPAVLLLMLYAFLRYVGAIHFDLPGMGWLSRRLDTAAILETLALATEHHRPLPETVASLAESYHKRSIRRRLLLVRQDLQAGADWCASLLARGLIKPADAAILEAAQRAGNLAWAMREMADSNRRRLAYRLQVAHQLLFPPCILVLAAVVMFFVVGLFIPLVSMIQDAAAWS